MYGLVSHAYVQGARIRIGVDGNGLDAHGACRFNDAAGNLAAVCNQDIFLNIGSRGALHYKGMLPCLRHGFSSFLSRSMANERQMRLRVACGMMTSST